MRPLRLLLSLNLLLLSGVVETACAEEVIEESDSLTKNVLSLLAAKCGKCHGQKRVEGNLDVRSLNALLKGGVSGDVLSPGNPSDSPIWIRIEDGDMPPEGNPGLSERETALVKNWIQSLPKSLAYVPADEDPKSHWIYQKPSAPTPPQVSHPSRARNPIDLFILKQLGETGLTLNTNARQEVLIRRLYFDLLGIPPAPADITRFISDSSPDAYESLVDELLNSRHYGERWARHWLDVVGYADSSCAASPAFDVNRSEIWRYRDYVIKAFNDDMPYDQFIREQLAGDELVSWRNAPTFTDEISRCLIATGFLRCAQDCTRVQVDDPVVEMQHRHNARHESFETAMNAILGINLHCARCHDHKNDPITQVEYYQMLALFSAAYDVENWIPAMEYGQVEPKDLRFIMNAGKLERDRIRIANRSVNAEIEKLLHNLDVLEAQSRAEVREQEMEKMNPLERSQLRIALDKKPDARSPKEVAAVNAFESRFGFTVGTLTKKHPAFKADYDRIFARIKSLQKQRPIDVPYIRALWDLKPDAHPTAVLRRGDFRNPGQIVKPGIARCFDDRSRPFQPPQPKPDDVTTGRRKALALFLTRPDSPLTARVMVNRVWFHHFGRGIIDSLDDVGLAGEKPTHPSLLDWLAVQFVKDGWSIKKLHRLILCSSTYRQSSSFDPLKAKRDPENRLYWRWEGKRIEAEAIRDSMLFVAGVLDTQMYGQQVALGVGADGQVIVSDASPGKFRKTIYIRQRRSEPVSFLEVFDAPKMVTNCTERHHSISPLQSLSLLNNRFVVESARQFAERVRVTAGENTKNQISRAYWLAFGRLPSDEEKVRIMEFFRETSSLTEQTAGTSSALLNLCHMLLASNEFVYIH